MIWFPVRRKIAWGAVLGVVACAAPCLADTMTFTATLSGANQVPANASSGTGTANLSLTGDMLTVTVMFAGLSGPVTAAHIHCCAPAGANASVVVPFTAFPAATSGTYTNTFNLATLTYPTGVTEALLIAGFSNGMTYVNLHDALYPAGEIRGQVQALSAVPEPGSLVLLGTGVMGLGMLSLVGTTRRRFGA